MIEQLTQLAQQFGLDSVVKNDAIPNEQNEAVLGEASNSILSSLKNIASEGNVSELAGLFQGNNATDASNPIVQRVSQELTTNLGDKFGLTADAASGVASGLVPQVLNGLVGKAKDPNDSSFQISDLIGSITSGGASAGIMSAISGLGSQFNLDQNGDGKVDMSDAMDAITKKGGGFLSSLFGKK